MCDSGPYMTSASEKVPNGGHGPTIDDPFTLRLKPSAFLTADSFLRRLACLLRRLISDILSPLPGKRQGATFVFNPGDRHHREAFTVSIQESQRHNPTGIPNCPRCLKPMVLKGKRPMPFTNLAEEIYRCETCGTETKRIIKDR